MGKVLKIDTANNKQISVTLEANGQKSEISEDSTVLRSEAALPVIEKLLKQNKLGITEIDEIEVNKGPGSFTGLKSEWPLLMR